MNKPLSVVRDEASQGFFPYLAWEKTPWMNFKLIFHVLVVHAVPSVAELV